MSMSRSFFTLKPPNSSDGGFPTFGRIGSEEHRPSMEVGAPCSPQAVHPQLGRMLHIPNHVEIQHRYTVQEQESLHQLRALNHTFSVTPLVGFQRYFHGYVGPTHMNRPMMPQSYAMDGRECMGGFAAMASIADVGNHSWHMQTHLALQEHVPSDISIPYKHEMLKRKAVTTELSLGLSIYNADSTREKHFSVAKTPQDEVQMHVAKKKTMSLSLYNEEDANEDVERAAREIQFFPQNLARDLRSNKSEFSVYEWSSPSGGGVDVESDLSLKLSTGGSGIAMDLSLKLNSSGA